VNPELQLSNVESRRMSRKPSRRGQTLPKKEETLSLEKERGSGERRKVHGGREGSNADRRMECNLYL